MHLISDFCIPDDHVLHFLVQLARKSDMNCSWAGSAPSNSSTSSAILLAKAACELTGAETGEWSP
jgi:hypothetical protein